MTLIKTNYNRRSFLKVSALASGGLMIGFNWGCSPTEEERQPPSAWFEMNSFLSVADNGQVTIMSPNPEIGQNVKTSMPMLVAEELDTKWEDVIVEQGMLDEDAFTRQVAGGSQSIRQGWKSLRMAGATARAMLIAAAAQQWGVSPADCTTKDGMIISGSKKIGYGEVASAAASLAVPDNVKLKDPKNFSIIGNSKRNVDLDKIVSGAPVFGMDFHREGMLHAVVARPPAFGMTLESYDDSDTMAVNGVTGTLRFGDKVAVLATNTWAGFKGKKALKVKWKASGKLENTADHNRELLKLLDSNGKAGRNDGNVKTAFAQADKVIEKVYEAPFLPHNTMAPMNFFADVTDSKVELIGPIQTPQWTQSRVAQLLDRPKEQVTVGMTRMGGGFGRRLYGDFALEAAEISSMAKKPIKVVFSREDDMTAGTYRPASKYKFRAAVKDGKITGYHLTGAGVGGKGWTRDNWFPAGGIENYRVESYGLDSNITTGAWRAPITNFLAVAEQSFFDEVADEMGVDAVQLRLDILERAKNNPVGSIDYEPEKMIGAIKLAAEKGNWGTDENGISKGFSCYYSHNTYVAEVAHVRMNDGNPYLEKMTTAVDCGIVVNPEAAINQVQGGVVDGVGHAMYGEFSFVNGEPQASNFNNYRLIRMKEAPKVDVHFVESYNDPTGLGEPSLPPAGGALANAIAKATGTRLYKIPFVKESIVFG